MDKIGMVVYPNGDYQPFGKIVYINDPYYINKSGHEEYFRKEILNSEEFANSNIQYDDEKYFYNNLIDFSLSGLSIILNNSQTESKMTFISYVPKEPTLEQLATIKNLLIAKRELLNSKNDIYEFQGDGYDDYLKYSDLNNYCMIKERQLSSHR